jgi:hypothetical protein
MPKHPFPSKEMWLAVLIALVMFVAVHYCQM